MNGIERSVLIAAAGLMAAGFGYHYYLGGDLKTFLKPEPAPKSAAEQWVNPVSKTRDSTHYDDDVLRAATFDSIRPKLDYVDSGSGLEAIGRARFKLKCVDDWAKALPEGEVKDAYLLWIGYYRKDYDQREDEIRNPKPTKVDEYEARRKERERKAAELDIARVPTQTCVAEEKQ